MMKMLESNDPNSCWNKAKDHEIVFVLIEKDESAPGTINDWCDRRIKAGKNTEGDAQIK